MQILILYIIGAVVVPILTAYSNTTRKKDEIELYACAFFFWPVMLLLLYFSWLDEISKKQTAKKKQKDGNI